MAQVASTTTGTGQAGQGAASAAAGKGGKGLSQIGGPGWQPIQLGRDFRLDDALNTAVGKAARQINKSLGAEGLMVSLPQGATENGAAAPQKTINVTEKETNTVLKTYDIPSFLAFYAAREKTSGVIVDGQV